MAPRRVVVTAFDGVELLDLTGPLEVLSAATRALAGRPGGYRTAVAGPRSGPVECAGGTRLVAEVAWDEVRLPIDTLIVAGALSLEHGRATAVVDERLVQWVRSTAPRCRRVVSVCAGAHVLAEAGLLDGRRAATHWATAHELARRSDRIVVDPDAIFVRDGFVWTSAGVSSGLDLTLALVAEDHGEALARQLARWLVMYLKRPGGQSQFSAALAVDVTEQPAIRSIQEWLPDHLEEDCSVTGLARRANVSVRHFARLFRNEVGVTPAEYVESLRVEAAGRHLVETDAGLERVARACGFGSVESLHRAFRGRFGVTPGAYRARFRLRSTVS